MSSCRCAMPAAEPGRIYRKISYGPLLDVFLLDMRSYRGPNGANPQSHYGPGAYLLGPVQLAWIKRELRRSSATWKVIASDTPLGTIAATTPGARTPLGRGIEIADLLSFMRRAGIRNTLWLTADLHYTAAHYFDPNNCGLPGLRTILGIRFRPDPCRHLDTFGPRSDIRPAYRLSKRCEPGAGRRPCPLFRSAILWPRSDRRKDRGLDGDSQRCRRSGIMVYSYRAKNRSKRTASFAAVAGLRGPWTGCLPTRTRQCHQFVMQASAICQRP